MEAPHPTAGWEQVGERFYRKTQLYTAIFDQDLDLDNYIVTGAPYSGAIGEISYPFLHLPISTHSPRLSLAARGALTVRAAHRHLSWPSFAPCLRSAYFAPATGNVACLGILASNFV